MAKKTARKKKSSAARRGRTKSVYLRNFTGVVKQNPDKTVSVVGRGRRGRTTKAKKGARR